MPRGTYFCHPEGDHDCAPKSPKGGFGAKKALATGGSAFSGVPFFASIALLIVFAAWLFAGPARAGDKPVAWKPIQQALLRIDDQPVKNWNVYEESKKGDPLLLEMGNRFLLIEVHDRKIFELAAAKIEHKGSDILWDPAARPAEPLATSNWVIRDVGFAYRIGARLVAENRAIDLQLPHPMDLRYL